MADTLICRVPECTTRRVEGSWYCLYHDSILNKTVVEEDYFNDGDQWFLPGKTLPDLSDTIVERLARVLCKAQGTDPDTLCWGTGAIMPVGWNGPAWEVRIPYVKALLADMQGAGMLKSAPQPNDDVRDFEGAGI